MLWVTTPSGRKWPLLRPSAADVDVQDIAQNLSLQVRYNGSCGAYTVAEHSVHCHDEAVRRKLPNSWCLLVLLHDAHEAYLGDIVTPVINALSVLLEDMDLTRTNRSANKALDRLRERTDRVIFQALGVDFDLPGEAFHTLRQIDAAAMMTERDALHPNQPEPWGLYENIPRLSFKPQCWSASAARHHFLERLSAYTDQVTHPAA